jgi:5S rRNA maturation endonuclease (ribonuclease M5)
LIKRHTNQNSQVIVMLDEDEAGRAGREDIAVRLSQFVFVKVHTFEQEGEQPESLTAEQLGELV